MRFSRNALGQQKFFPILLARIHDQVSRLVFFHAQAGQVARGGAARQFAVFIEA